jgi:hypothetical protein
MHTSGAEAVDNFNFAKRTPLYRMLAVPFYRFYTAKLSGIGFDNCSYSDLIITPNSERAAYDISLKASELNRRQSTL